MPQYTPHHSGNTAPITSQASAAVIGARCVSASGNNTVANSGAAAVTVLGIAAHDAVTGDKLAVWPLQGVVHEVTGAGVVAAGDLLATGANGTVAAIGAGTFGQVVGKALAGAADGATVRFIGF
jgi:ornithine cyclodeaminase/alanine dehydrogenase-like protein (mu-crystallin family)